MSNQLVWVDIPVRDLDRAIAFYSAVLAQKVTKEGGQGFSLGVLPHGENDVGGCLYVPEGDNAPSITGPLIYLNAEGRLGDAVSAVRTHGGTVLVDIHAIGPHGYRALVTDSEGNRIALHASRSDS
jgi:predicted enzyme related to lactoylglutathione lyase